MRRLMRELAQLKNEPLEGIRVAHPEDNMLDVTGIIEGPGACNNRVLAVHTRALADGLLSVVFLQLARPTKAATSESSSTSRRSSPRRRQNVRLPRFPPTTFLHFALPDPPHSLFSFEPPHRLTPKYFCFYQAGS